MEEQRRPSWRRTRRRSLLDRCLCGSASSRHCCCVALLLWATAYCAQRLDLQSVVVSASSNGEFEPYVLNGGLVSAVAGKDYFVLACDTRLSGHSGYDISERHHVSSRLWSPLTTTTTRSSGTSKFIAPDGSLALNLLSSETEAQKDVLTLHETAIISDSQYPHAYAPVWIGSVGCMADCEHLKRDLRADLRAAQHFGDVPATATTAAATTSLLLTDHVAVALSQTLYSRRSFPYYAFCLCAGIGQVFVYDAVGSYEQVAVACTGTGKSLLQPILDRKFRAAATNRLILGTDDSAAGGGIPATIVDCESPERAVQLLLEGYRSVAEREIMVGDRVVFYTVQKEKDNGTLECKIWTAELRKH